ncbi:DHA2 family multidrug resistance protein-like MFS transporter [Thalassospira sp. MBR-102]|jgi:DHA2 family multidrug resistance protein-like MFS transporter|uniref:MFS transporter n=1 Tax=Thalassospira xiamenensis TaxID=220697 RepID=A0ABR5XZY7_9PROT|nr:MULTISPECIES: MFS transporter [Thalassospira]MAL28687.1 MFS transporter [Thalassospira sp.]MBR9779233.1 MFS transporter [Rhodospirillales bacterium]KZD02985.1 MFS transporter [Thalassospira xiamenensis]KZD08479.1 MFS transporter [Thalassospira xiamenensis]MAL29536.1 MFS transporter [Thalassospira sp.]|tara:strand:- start:16362 stop:18011 length:1650 start_codon:yes stop_codon:yes gene_type:complete
MSAPNTPVASPTDDTAQTDNKATRREWIGLLVLTLPCLLIAMDMTVLHLAVPALTASLNPTSDQLLWIVDIYGFFIAGSLITMGTLGDRIGRRKLLMIGGGCFGAASVLAAFSDTPEMLIFARGVLGIAGATLMPSTLSLIRSMFHNDKERSFAIAAWMTTFMVGTAAGPLLGGLVLSYFWWGAVFLLNVPVMGLLLIVAPILLPEHKAKSFGRLDLFSAALSLGSVLAIIYGVKVVAAYGFGSDALSALVFGLLGAWVFIRRQRKLADPLLDLDLLKQKTIALPIVIQTAVIFAGMAYFLFLSQALQLVIGLTPIQAGLSMLPATVAGIVGSMGAPVLMGRFKPGQVMTGALILTAAGFGMLSWPGSVVSLYVLVAGATIFSLGITPVAMICTDMVVASAPSDRAGSAAAMSETSAELGGALGIAILGSVGTAIYRDVMIEAVPTGIGNEAADAIRSTLGGAVNALHDLPAAISSDILPLARAAFTDGLQVISIICTILMVLSAIGTLFALRDVHCDTNNDDGTDGVNGDTPYDPAIKQAACATGNVE